LPLNERELQGAFGRAMARLGPFEPRPALAIAVSGGADSLALAVLAQAWAAGQGGTVLALVVDHGLRPESAMEARQTIARLGRRDIAARLLTLRGLAKGPALAERARAARYAALEAACADLGILHLLLGHHAGDQVETLRMRQEAGSGPRGLAGMSAIVERRSVRLLRPILGIPPGALRALLRHAGLDWVEDPSNRDPATLRARIRADLADPEGTGTCTRALLERAWCNATMRSVEDGQLAEILAARVTLYPAGWAVLTGGPIAPGALAALLRAIGGKPYGAGSESVAALAGAPRPATLGGARLLPAGAAGPAGAWLVVREAAAMATPVPAETGALWDRRFRVHRAPPGLSLGAVGCDSAQLRRHARGWPAAVLATLPALRAEGRLAVVPHLGWPDQRACQAVSLCFAPPHPLAGAPFLPSDID
jgi:tRNA(Ile)-lysidine synthase